MFERKKFKRAALVQLKSRWKIPVLTTLLIAAIIGILEYIGSARIFQKHIYGGDYSNFFIYTSGTTSAINYIVSIFVYCISITFCIASLSVCDTMLREEGEIYFSDFTNGLNQWFQAIRGGLWFMLWVYLWSLLLVIPGIVKAYSYSMMFFIMAEHPKIGVCKAMRISKELTRGYKGDLFVLDLSFVGWAILASIPFGVGWLWLVPYMNMTKTNAYQYLKQTAIDSNRIRLEDFE